MKEYKTLRINKKAWEQLMFLARLNGRTVLSQIDFIVREEYARQMITSAPRGSAIKSEPAQVAAIE